MKIYFEFDLQDPGAENFMQSLLFSLQQHKGIIHEQESKRAESPQEIDRNASGDQGGETVGQQAEQVEEAGSPAISKDAAFEALRAYIEANGGVAAKALLAEFGVGRFGELGEEHYPALIKRIGGGA